MDAAPEDLVHERDEPVARHEVVLKGVDSLLADGLPEGSVAVPLEPLRCVFVCDVDVRDVLRRCRDKHRACLQTMDRKVLPTESLLEPSKALFVEHR